MAEPALTPPEMMDPRAYPSLGALLEDACLQFKSEVCLIEARRDREQKRLRYLDVRREVAKVAAHFVELGVGPGSRVAILMSNQARWLIAASAAFHRGATVVPLDRLLSGAEQDALLDHCRADLLVVEYGLFRRLGEQGERRLLVSEAPDDAELPAKATRYESLEAAELPPLVPQTRDDIATIVYSSGTGGRAKGCLLPHDAYLEQIGALMEIFPMRVGHRMFSILPTNHAIDFMVGFLGPFCTGATIIHQRTLRPEFLLKTMQTYRVTHMAVVPRLLAAFEDAIDERLAETPTVGRKLVGLLSGINEKLTRRAPNQDVSRRLLGPVHEAFGGHLELMFCGGAFVDRRRAERFNALGLPVAVGYGLTEACTVATVNDLKPFRGDTVGAAVPGVELRIHDPGPDGVGEVWIRGRTLFRGYLDDPELTAETLTDDGWLRTGDLGWLDAAHHLHLVGRSKNLIVTEGGKNVYPEDIEGAFEGLPVEELVVFASGYLWPRSELLGSERLVAVVRPKDDGDGLPAIAAELRRRNQRLPEYKRVHGLLQWDEAFPRTASMKVKRAALGDSLRDGASPSDVGAL